MADIKKTVDKVALKDLTYTMPVTSPTAGSNLIEPTEQMIKDVIAELRVGKSYAEIKELVKVPGKKLNLSFGQIKQIHKAMDARIASLAPEIVEVE